MLSKNANKKNVLLNWYSFFNEKKIEKECDDFWHKNFGTFWHLTINPILKKKSFRYVDF